MKTVTLLDARFALLMCHRLRWFLALNRKGREKPGKDRRCTMIAKWGLESAYSRVVLQRIVGNIFIITEVGCKIHGQFFSRTFWEAARCSRFIIKQVPLERFNRISPPS